MPIQLNKPKFFSKLPEPALARIAFFLSGKALTRLEIASQRVRQYMEEDHRWAIKIKDDFGIHIETDAFETRKRYFHHPRLIHRHLTVLSQIKKINSLSDIDRLDYAPIFLKALSNTKSREITHYFFVQACHLGNLKLAQWLMHEGRGQARFKLDLYPGPMRETAEAACELAFNKSIEKGHLDIYVCLRKQNALPYRASAKHVLSAVIKTGNLRFVRWLIHEDGYQATKKMLREAIIAGNLDLLKCLLGQDSGEPFHIKTDEFKEDIEGYVTSEPGLLITSEAQQRKVAIPLLDESLLDESLTSASCSLTEWLNRFFIAIKGNFELTVRHLHLASKEKEGDSLTWLFSRAPNNAIILEYVRDIENSVSPLIERTMCTLHDFLDNPQSEFAFSYKEFLRVISEESFYQGYLNAGRSLTNDMQQKVEMLIRTLIKNSYNNYFPTEKVVNWSLGENHRSLVMSGLHLPTQNIFMDNFHDALIQNVNDIPRSLQAFRAKAAFRLGQVPVELAAITQRIVKLTTKAEKKPLAPHEDESASTQPTI